MPSTLTTYVAPFTGSLMASGGSVAGSILGQQLAQRLRDGASRAYDAVTFDRNQYERDFWSDTVSRQRRQSPVSEQIQPYRAPQQQTPWREHPRSREFREEDRRNYEYHRRYSKNIQRIYNRPPTQLIMPPVMSCSCPPSGHTNKCSTRYRRKKSSKKMTMYRAPKPESHYVDIPSVLSTWVNDAPNQVWLLNTVPQGAGITQRTGKRIRLVGLQVRGSIWASSNTSSTYVDCSMLIVYDKRPTGALPLQTDILTTSDCKGFMNDNNTGRFRILRRVDFVLSGNTAPASINLTNAVKSLDTYVSLKGLTTVFESAGTGGIGDIDMGALYFVPLSSRNTAGSLAPSSDLSFRVRFTDS